MDHGAIDKEHPCYMVRGPLAGSGRYYRTARRARNARDRLDMQYGAAKHVVVNATAKLWSIE